uniref:TPT domain-containing protein n=1 Tax=Bursaphelenchus xylophilus TaxID=6326 RepID=A0A1I7RMH2_BURXY
MYGVTAFSIVFVNKLVLSVYRFPSFLVLSLLQTVFTVALLCVLNIAGKLEIKRPSKNVLIAISPLVVLFLFNLTFGLGSTKYLTLPMFTSLRHSTVFVTMILEFVFLRVTPKKNTVISVGIIVLGAVLAACFDLNFNLMGYLYVTINNTATALNGVYVKHVFNKDASVLKSLHLSRTWIFFQLNPNRVTLAVLILLSLISGLFLGYFMFQCTKYNSALGTAFIGVFKNVIITYAGMFTGDYDFNWCNFFGVTLATLGSLTYLASVFSSPTVVAEKTEAKDVERNAVIAA